MKGNKSFLLATSIGQKIYAYPKDFNGADLKNLYLQYLYHLRKSAYSGHLDAMYELGQQYEDTSYMKNANVKKCFYWYSKACTGGHPEACNNLAFLYETGGGCKKNLNIALSLYKKASELGSLSGKKNYKVMLRDVSKGGKYNI